MKIDNKEVQHLKQLLQDNANAAEEQAERERQAELAKREAEERARQEEEEARAMEAARLRREEEERRIQELSRMELERQRLRQKERERAEAERIVAEKKKAREDAIVDEFLKEHGFKDVNEMIKIPSGFMRSRKCSALHLAVELNDPDVVSLLVQRGADIRAKNGKGKIPFDIAQKLGQENPDSKELLEVLRVK
jgi:hypothetical protein